jgi:hypothetical protein
MSLGLKRKEPEADHSIPFSAGVENARSYLSGFSKAEVKNTLSHTFTPPYARPAYIYVVWATWEKFGLQAGNMTFITHN